VTGLESELDRVASRIGVSTMTDGDHSYHHEFVIDLIDHAELPSARRIAARQLVA
jgi:calcineurin-like phosphoesterase